MRSGEVLRHLKEASRQRMEAGDERPACNAQVKNLMQTPPVSDVVAADPHRQDDMLPPTYRFLGLEIIPRGMDLLARRAESSMAVGAR